MNTTTEVTELARCNDISPVRVLLGLMRAADKLSTADLAAVRVVAGALSSVTGSELLWRADSAAGLEQARADYGCPRCGVIGMDRCRTATGGTRKTWHAARKY